MCYDEENSRARLWDECLNNKIKKKSLNHTHLNINK